MFVWFSYCAPLCLCSFFYAFHLFSYSFLRSSSRFAIVCLWVSSGFPMVSICFCRLNFHRNAHFHDFHKISWNSAKFLEIMQKLMIFQGIHSGKPSIWTRNSKPKMMIPQAHSNITVIQWFLVESMLFYQLSHQFT